MDINNPQLDSLIEENEVLKNAIDILKKEHQNPINMSEYFCKKCSFRADESKFESRHYSQPHSTEIYLSDFVKLCPKCNSDDTEKVNIAKPVNERSKVAEFMPADWIDGLKKINPVEFQAGYLNMPTPLYKAYQVQYDARRELVKRAAHAEQLLIKEGICKIKMFPEYYFDKDKVQLGVDLGVNNCYSVYYSGVYMGNIYRKVKGNQHISSFHPKGIIGINGMV